MEVQAALQLAWLLIVLMHLMLGKFNSVLVFVLFFYLLLYSAELGFAALACPDLLTCISCFPLKLLMPGPSSAAVAAPVFASCFFTASRKETESYCT